MKKRNSERGSPDNPSKRVGGGVYDLRMAKWEFPPVRPEDEYEALMARLAAQASKLIRDQHVVSKVILKGFASPGQKGAGWQLSPFDVQRGHEMKRRGLAGCGKVENFLSWASASAEMVWKDVEDKLGDAIDAARKGALDEGQSRTLKDGIALHYARSMHYMKIHSDSVQGAAEEVRREVVHTRRDELIKLFIEKYGLHPAGTEALSVLIEPSIRRWLDMERSGALARASMEQNFNRVRATLQPQALEVWSTPPGSELLISDSPAFTYQYTFGSITKITPNVAIGDSHGVALPIAKDCLITIGAESKVGQLDIEQVDLFNRLQVIVAHKHVYYRPGSSLGAFVKSALPGRTSA